MTTFTLNDKTYSTDAETLEVLHSIMPNAKASGDSSAVIAVIELGKATGRIVEETITTAQQSRMVKTFQDIAKDQPVSGVEVIRDCFYIFTTELGMYRIADKYTTVASKGFSKNLNTWYVAIKRGI